MVTHSRKMRAKLASRRDEHHGAVEVSSTREGRPRLRAFLLLQHWERDVSSGSAVVIDLVGVMASFYALV